MTSPQQNTTSTPRYVPPQRRSPTYRGQPYLTYEDLHTRYSPPNSPRLRMPYMQPSLSAEDLYRQFQQQENQSENQPPNQKPQGQEPPDNTTSSPSPPLLDLETLRTYRPPKTPIRSEQPLKPVLSPRLPDPSVFNDKLLLNRDHYPTNAFQINYVISRLDEKANEHTMHKRRNATTNPYLSIDDVLNQLSDLYETPLHIQYHANHHICENLKQRTEQPFPEFYTELMRTVTNTPLFLALIQKNIDVEKTLDCSAAKSRVTYQSDLLTLSPAERPDTVRTTYDLIAESTQIRDLQLLLCVNTNNKGDLMRLVNQHTIRQNIEHAVFERFGFV
ncbi:MAG: hypothetical protein ASARMPRED_001597 [Alectoria sarmentosa]|nr:MAG: hypothetical protein ASARMPRED_001597 [Alectoria sarmentosa]